MADNIGTTQTQTNNDTSLYSMKVVLGKVGTPGAPIVNLDLTVQAVSGHVSGMAEISQALHPHMGHHRFPVSGNIYHLRLGPNHQLVLLSGEFHYSLPPPAIGEVKVPFEAFLLIDNDWNGSGGFTYLKTHVENVPVKTLHNTTATLTAEDDTKLQQMFDALPDEASLLDCNTYREFRPILETALRIIPKIPHYGSQIAKAVSFLMKLADDVCPVSRAQAMSTGGKPANT